MNDWEIFEEYIVQRLKEIDPNCRRTPGSGNKGLKGDIYTNAPIHIEAKQRSTKSVTINNEVWEKLNQEIPLHVKKLPVLALENKDKKRWVALDLDDFFDILVELTQLRKNLEK